MSAPDGNLRRERHTGTGRTRVVCDDCGWISGEFDQDWKADLAASAHAEAVHGTTIEV